MVQEAPGTAAGRLTPRTGLLLVVLASLVSSRLVGLAQFPVVNPDEGLWTICTKNYVAFGDWFMDGRVHLFLSPMFHGLSWIAFTMAGPSIGAARAISAAMNLVSVALLYLLVLRTSRQRTIAVLATILFGFSHAVVIISRQALLEPTALAFQLGSTLLLTYDSRLARASSALIFALALLTKLTTVFMLPVLVYAQYLSSSRGPTTLGRRSLRAGMWAAISLSAAGLAYATLYRADPDRFTRAFSHELRGAHFVVEHEPSGRVGRFGASPVASAETLREAFRVEPFLMVLASVGMVFAAFSWDAGARLFVPWAIVGGGFFLLQVYQPLRYFHLIFPALAYCAALAVDSLGREGRFLGWRLPLGKLAAIGLYLIFNLSHIVVGALTHSATEQRLVKQWVVDSTLPEARILAVSHFCVDLPRRAYGYDVAESRPERLMERIREHDIDYVIYDRQEWPRELGDFLRETFSSVQEWPFGAAYDVNGSPP